MNSTPSQPTPWIQPDSWMPHNAEHERDQADTLVRILLDRGYSISVNDGVEVVLKRSIKRDVILAALGSTSSDSLICYDENGERLAWFWLVYGNGPGELIADHTANRYAESVWNAWAEVVGEIG